MKMKVTLPNLKFFKFFQYMEKFTLNEVLPRYNISSKKFKRGIENLDMNVLSLIPKICDRYYTSSFDINFGNINKGEITISSNNNMVILYGFIFKKHSTISEYCRVSKSFRTDRLSSLFNINTLDDVEKEVIEKFTEGVVKKESW